MPPRRGDSSRRSAVLAVLKRKLWKHPGVVEVRYVPDSIEARAIRADLDPGRLVGEDGAQRTATLDVEWRPESEDPDWFRIHYADPDAGVACGWHRDADHPELGPAHVQYRVDDGDPEREPFAVEATAPPGILWECLADLERVLLERASPD